MIRRTILLLSVVAISVLGGCSGTGVESLNYKAVFGVVASSADYFDLGISTLRTAAAAENVGLIIRRSNDVNTQDSDIQSMISSGVDALIVMAEDTESSVSQAWVGSADTAGIPFVCWDRLISDVAGIDFFVTFDSTEVGRIQAQYIVDNTSDGDEILMVRGPSSDSNADAFEAGAIEILQPYIDGTTRTIFAGAAQAVEWWPLDDTDDSVPGNTAQELIEGLSDIELENFAAVLSPNDGVFTSYTGNYATEACLLNALLLRLSESEVASLVITGQDATIPGLKGMLASPQLLDMTILKNQTLLVDDLMSNTLNLVNGDALVSNATINNGSEDVPSYMEDPVLVEISDIQNLIIDSGFYTAVELGL